MSERGAGAVICCLKSSYRDVNGYVSGWNIEMA